MKEALIYLREMSSTPFGFGALALIMILGLLALADAMERFLQIQPRPPRSRIRSRVQEYPPRGFTTLELVGVLWLGIMALNLAVFAVTGKVKDCTWRKLAWAPSGGEAEEDSCAAAPERAARKNGTAWRAQSERDAREGIATHPPVSGQILTHLTTLGGTAREDP